MLTALTPALQEQVRQSVWTRESQVYQDRLRLDLKEFMRKWPAASRVMDAGCGDGYGIDIIKQKGHNPVGFDINEGKLAVARSLGHEVVFCNLEEIGVEEGTFDIVWCRHVLEHLTKPDLALRCFWKALRIGGILSLIVPVVEKPTKKHPTIVRNVEEVVYWIRGAGFWKSKAELRARPYGDEIWVWGQRRA